MNEVVSLLVKAGASVDLQNKVNLTMIHNAVYDCCTCSHGKVSEH